MSVLATTWAWEQELPSHLKLVLLALSDHADDFGLCWPSVERVAKKCGLDERNVRRNLRELERRGGTLVRDFRPGRSTHYRLLLTRPKTPHLAEHPGQNAPPLESKGNGKRGGKTPRASTPPTPGVHAPPPRASTPPITIKEPSQNRHPSASPVPSEPSKPGLRPAKFGPPKQKKPAQEGLFPGSDPQLRERRKAETERRAGRRAQPSEPPPELKDCPLFLADEQFARYAWGRLNAWKKTFCRVNDWALAMRYAHAKAAKQAENGRKLENVPGFLEEFLRWYQRDLLRTDAKDLAEESALEKREDRASRNGAAFAQGRRGNQAAAIEPRTAGEILAGIARAAVNGNGGTHG